MDLKRFLEAYATHREFVIYIITVQSFSGYSLPLIEQPNHIKFTQTTTTHSSPNTTFTILLIVLSLIFN